MSASWKDIKFGQPIPQVVEGEDFFNDQAYADAWSAPLQIQREEPEQVTKLREEVRSMLAFKNLSEDEIFYRFRMSLDNLGAMQLLEAKNFVEKIYIKPTQSWESPKPKLYPKPKLGLQGVRARVLRKGDRFYGLCAWIRSFDNKSVMLGRPEVPPSVKTDTTLVGEWGRYDFNEIELWPKPSDDSKYQGMLG